MWNYCPSLEFLIAQTQSSAEWHLLVSWACSLSTCWCDLFALWSFSSLFCRPGMWPFSKASYLAVPAPESPPRLAKKDTGVVFLCLQGDDERRRSHTLTSFQAAISSADLSCRSTCVCYGWKRIGGGGRGVKQQKIPNTCPGIPGMSSEFPNLLRFKFSYRGGVAPPCCSMSAVMHAGMCPWPAGMLLNHVMDTQLCADKDCTFPHQIQVTLLSKCFQVADTFSV